MSFYDFLAGLIGFGGMAKDAIETGAAMSDPMQQMIMPGDAFYIDAAGEFRFFNGRKCYEEHVMGETYLVDKKSGKRTSVNSIIHAERIRKGLEEDDKNLTAIWYGGVLGPRYNLSSKTDNCITGDPDPHMWGPRFYDKETRRVFTIRTFYWIPELYCINQRYQADLLKYVKDEEIIKRLRHIGWNHSAEFFVDVKTKEVVRLSDYTLMGDKYVLNLVAHDHPPACCYGDHSWVPQFIEKQNRMHINTAKEIERERPKYYGTWSWGVKLREAQDAWAYQGDPYGYKKDPKKKKEVKYFEDINALSIAPDNIIEWMEQNAKTTEIIPRKTRPFLNDYCPAYREGRLISDTRAWWNEQVAF